MAEKATCYVTNSQDGRGAYAVRADNDQTVYVPQRISDRLTIEVMDTIEAVLVRNPRDAGSWMAIHVRLVETTQP